VEAKWFFSSRVKRKWHSSLAKNSCSREAIFSIPESPSAFPCNSGRPLFPEFPVSSEYASTGLFPLHAGLLVMAPKHFLYFLSEPQGQGELRWIFATGPIPKMPYILTEGYAEVTRENENRQAIENKSLRLVEAGGVEPPSEKRYGSKTTCLARFRLFRQPRSE
jgi:hypothetical protein